MTAPLQLMEIPMLGHVAIAFVTPEDGVLRACGFDDIDALHSRMSDDLRARGYEPAPDDHPVADALRRYADGDVHAIDDLAVRQPEGPFHADARIALRTVEAGRPITYTELAAAAGRPQAVRAAASACASNLVALVVPCHRIVRTDGGLGGYAYGVDLKRALLDHEAAHSGKH